MRQRRQRATKTNTAIRREQILQAALSVVGEHGPRALTVAAVAAQVGVVPSGIYRHFHGKDAILEAVFVFIRHRLLANAAAVRAQSSDAEERLRLLHLRHLRLIRAQRGLPRLIFSDEAAGDNPASRQRLLAVIRAYLADVADMIRSGQEAGTLRPDMVPETAALLFLGLIQPSVILWHLSDGRFDVTSESTRCWRLFSDAIRAKEHTMNSQIDEKNTVRDLVVAHPQTRKLLESFGIDTCCGGGSTLADAAGKAGVALADVVAAIQRAAATPSSQAQADERAWNTATLTALAEHIESTHHVFMKDVLPLLDELFAKVLSAHGARHGDMLRPLQRTFAGLRAEIEMHLAKEEQVLFPYIREMDAAVTQTGMVPPMHCGTVSNPIRQMEHEHENAGAALARMRALTGDYALPADACPTFATLFDTLRQLEADLHEHIHLENNILFPRAEAMEQHGE